METAIQNSQGENLYKQPKEQHTVLLKLLVQCNKNQEDIYIFSVTQKLWQQINYFLFVEDTHKIPHVII